MKIVNKASPVILLDLEAITVEFVDGGKNIPRLGIPDPLIELIEHSVYRSTDHINYDHPRQLSWGVYVGQVFQRVTEELKKSEYLRKLVNTYPFYEYLMQKSAIAFTNRIQMEEHYRNNR